MICKYCQEELPEKAKFCLECGKKVEPEEEIEEILLEDAECAAEDETADEDVVVAEDEDPDEEEENVSAEKAISGSRKLKKMRRAAAITGCLAGLAVLGTLLVVGITGNWKIFDFLKHRDNNVYYKDSYSVEDSKAIKHANTVVGSMGDLKLTNAELQLYYWMQVYDFVDYYGYYASYFGLDYTAPLDTQEVSEGVTWQQYFLDSAVQNWQTYTALTLEAEANNFELPQDYQELLDKLEENMLKSATEAGFTTVDEMLADEMGAGVTYAQYCEYLRRYYTGYAYFQQEYDKIAPTDAEIEAYFTANEATFAGKSITKESGKYIDVRHILKKIDSYGTKSSDAASDDPNFGYSQEAWDACLADAQAILDAWLAGEKTEESFGTLAGEKTEDTGSKSTGGLYTGVKKGDMVAEFDAWCFDEVRVVGDYGIVKTQYGYHIMYFSGSEDIWFAEARNAYISDESNKFVEKVLTAHPIEMDYKKIVLAVVDFS